MKIRHAVLRIISLFVLTSLSIAALLAVSPTSAQTTEKGSIEGTAVDPQGGPVGGVTVTATRQGGGSVSVTTNEEGLFRIANLEPGNYTVTIEAGQGFGRIVQENVSVNAGKPASLALQLRVAASGGETVTVVASSDAAADVSVKLADLTGPLTIQTLPLNSRNFTDLVTLAPASAEPNSPTVKASTTTNAGITTAMFEMPKAIIWVNLPDDIRAGDTVSGTLTAEPKGTNKAQPQPETQMFRLEIPTDFRGLLVKLIESGKTVSSTEIKRSNFVFTPRYSFDRTRSDVSSETFIGQQGRAVEILGPFDGNLANTSLRFGPNGSGLGSTPVILAESPRRIFFRAPSDFTGPVEVTLRERDTVITGSYRNVGVRLSAPKTNLMRGERTTLTIEVSGLKGIIRDVPLQLDARGVITMDGGNFQNLRIKPEEVTVDGRYTTNRTITGQQAGGFAVTATVIVTPFDFTLQDDSDPNRIFHFNSFTGDYLFACGGASCLKPNGTEGATTGDASSKPGAPPVPSVHSGGLNFTGTGRPTMKGCIITLSHNAPDRRVFANLDVCNKTGSASVETKAPKQTINITDKNTADNTAPLPPPK